MLEYSEHTTSLLAAYIQDNTVSQAKGSRISQVNGTLRVQWALGWQSAGCTLGNKPTTPTQQQCCHMHTSRALNAH
jgi:hypothetical protein